LDPSGLLALLEIRVPLALKVIPVLLDLPGPRGLRGLLELMGRRALKDLPDQPDRKDHRDRLDLLGQWDHRDRRGRWGQKDRKDLRDPQEKEGAACRSWLKYQRLGHWQRELRLRWRYR
jgi:hypothetical protein